MKFPPVPPEMKSIAHFLKVAEEHEERNIVVAYWAVMYACQRAMKLVPGKKPPEVTNLMVALLEWMETKKRQCATTDGIINETTAHALIEEYALQLFAYGDIQDRAGNFNKNTIKAFYTAGILMDILEQFGTLPDDIQSKRKYAKWKAAYIHNCLKLGDIPISGAPDEQLTNVIHTADLDNEDENENIGQPGDASFSAPPPVPQTITPQPSVSPPSPSRPYVPPSVQTPAASTSSGYASLPPEKVKKAQKYCKFADSALDYEDFKTAVDNLNKALHLIQTGEEI